MGEKTLKCFISYSHMDKKLCERFRKYFSNIARLIDTQDWYDGMIPPGGNIDDEIKKQLELADVVFLLVSTDYISSFYCYEKELKRAIERHDANQCIVIPVILRDFVRDEDYLFSKLKYVPTDGKPVTQFKTQNDGFVDAFTAIKNLLLEFGTRRHSSKTRAKESSSTSISNKTTLADSTAPITEIQYKIVKSGRKVDVGLTQDVFCEVVNCSHKLAHFSTDMNTLTMESLEQFRSFVSKTPVQLRNKLYHRNFESFLFQIGGYIQHHFVGYDNTCIHFRVKDNNVYKDYFDIGYRKNGLSIDPIQAQDGMIACALKNKMPVIKDFNRNLHKKSHPKEKIERNYITFAFNTIFENHNINFSMCISVVGPTLPQTNDIFTAMSITRFDETIEKYLLQYINQCAKIDSRYDIGMIFKPEV